MPSAIAPATKQAVKNSYLKEGLSLAAAARKHGVSERLVSTWSAAEGWAAQKEGRTGDGGQAVKLVSFAPERGGVQSPLEPATSVAVPRCTEDLIEILDQAIARLATAVESPHDGRNRANAANALAKLIGQRVALADTHERKATRAALLQNRAALLQNVAAELETATLEP